MKRRNYKTDLIQMDKKQLQEWISKKTNMMLQVGDNGGSTPILTKIIYAKKLLSRMNNSENLNHNLLANGFISPKVEMPQPSEKNKNFSEKLMLLVGKRKYKGVFSFHFNQFYKDGFHVENYIFPIDKVDGWRLL